MKKNLIYVLAILLTSYVGAYPNCGELVPQRILKRADEARGYLEGVRWKVSIHAVEDKRIQKRKLEVKAKGYDFLAVLNSPPKVKGQKFLMINHNMWFSKPGLRKPVPVSPKQKLVGLSSYGDIAATNYADDYEARCLEDEMVEGELCYVFDLKACHKRATYDRIKYWVSKDRLVGVKAQYFAVSGKMLKSAVFEYDNQILLWNEPHPFISRMIIYDALVEGNVTSLTLSKPKLIPVPPSTFDINLF